MTIEDQPPDNPSNWRQLNIQFVDPHAAERHVVDHLGPALQHARSTGMIDSWFFIRKPWWRLRYLPTSADGVTETNQHLADVIGELGRCIEGIYEPEIHAFGGQQAMAAAHKLFHADSDHILDYLATPEHIMTNTSRRREISILLCTALMRAAGHDRYERGDVWAKVADHRPLPEATPPGRWHTFKAAVRRLTSVDTRTGTEARTGSLTQISTWLLSFEQAGRNLHSLAIEGNLSRGIRAVTAHHIIFHWNRIGLNVRTQAYIAHAAKEVVFHDGEI